jgi:hypothetical protein
MTDKREGILVRLAAICVAEQTAAGIVRVVRNRALLKNEDRPAIVLLDGDEKPASFQPQARTNSRYVIRPQLTRMSPELYVLLDEARPIGEGADGLGIGSVLNDKRIKLCAAIYADTALAALLGPNGGIVYNGCATDLKSGSALTGQMRLDFAFTYMFDPTT